MICVHTNAIKQIARQGLLPPGQQSNIIKNNK